MSFKFCITNAQYARQSKGAHRSDCSVSVTSPHAQSILWNAAGTEQDRLMNTATVPSRII